MSRGRPRKYKTKRESKAAKKAHTQLWYERVKAKRLRQPTGPLQVLELEVAECMRHKLKTMKFAQRLCGETASQSKTPTMQEQLQAELLRASIDIEHYLNMMEVDIRRYIKKKTSWEYAPFCGVLFGHAIQTLETDFRLTFDTTGIQTPNNWQYGDREEFRLTVLVNEETSEDWIQYKHLLKGWIDFMVIPWDPTSPLYEYHRARFTYRYVSGKLKEILEHKGVKGTG